jgi:hypothetical protein
VGSALISAMVDTIDKGGSLDLAMDAAVSLLSEIREGIDSLH